MFPHRRFLLVFAAIFTACTTGSGPTSRRAPEAWLSLPVAPRFGSVELDAEGKVTTRPERPPRNAPAGPIRLIDEFVGPKLANGEKIITEPLAEINSFDYSASRGEVVFSARRADGGFDIGLVSSDGGAIRWIPNDPADEIHVKWAPRGNKVSYVIRTPGGDVVRTLHIPTSASLPVDFPNATIHALAWDPPAERYAVASSTIDASDQVELLRYGGQERKIAIRPATRLDVHVEPFVPGAVLLRPLDLRYDEKLPLVVWRASDFGWSDARAALTKSARVAIVVTTGDPADELWRVAAATPWLDLTRTFTIGTGVHASAPAATIHVVADHALPPGHYRHTGRVVSVAPAVVQSVAAGFIADQLQRASATNGRSR